MTTARLSWGDSPIGLEVDNGRTFLRVGRNLCIDVTDASLQQVEELANVAADLADMRRDRDAAAEIPNVVAAEDGVWHIGVPAQRTGSVAA